MSQDNDELPYYPEDVCGGPKTQEFIINRLIGRIGTVTICRIVSVKAGGVSPVGFVDVVPMVLQVDFTG